ncbi:aldo/keto reductase [Draconibacterium sp. IB214405]|uniref:aldo/keto reductase n=1 Tax=Draconibacterium sp. IB214405 TaxID=3097352 RepID=UPI002A10B12D|nr:aldo/keto reductase [Draconibacterium sp. IB214405]MDX8339724.1 aldo/keto reductase [Draconibacterium sp. IB214405]
MDKVQLPSSDVKITPITFGAWAIGGWFWGGAEEKESVKAIEAAIANGMTTIDTAPVYGFGQSEEFVGKAIKGKRSKVELLTKFGLVWDRKSGHVHYEKTFDNQGNQVSLYRLGSKESVIKECEDCLKRLGTDYIDLFQQHWPDSSTPVEETMEALEILKDQGKIRAGGVSNYSMSEMEKAEKYFKLSSNQVPYSMVNRNIEDEVVPYCITNYKAIIAYSPLQRGVLTGKITADYKFSEGDHRPTTPFFKEPNLSRINTFLDKIKPIAEAKHATLAQLVLKWTLNQPGITCVLAGARNEKQVLENIKAMDVLLTENDEKQIAHHLNQLKLEI